MDKAQRHEAIRERAADAIRELYHNATLPWIKDLHGRSEDQCQAWLESACEFEMEYLQSGGCYGSNYRKTLQAPCNAGKYKSAAAQAYYVRKGMRAMHEERADCGMLTGWRVLELAAGNKTLARKLSPHYKGEPMTRNNSLWECATEYGKIYQYGRGGRTVAPADLVRTRGGSSFGMNEDYCEDRPIEACIRLIQVIESFNRYVTAWCKSVPEQWREYCAEEDADKAREKRRAAARKAKETRERNYWACRDVVTA